MFIWANKWVIVARIVDTKTLLLPLGELREYRFVNSRGWPRRLCNC